MKYFGNDCKESQIGGQCERKSANTKKDERKNLSPICVADARQPING
ncbi:hypothetical protein RESH_00526 [Rhodopirellula europaea SH398]|uniref:Uncharacterized protein n=1 Tax=Rhodopirellula europaea SH398 TaxID=1263868 RepID=M5SM83_9BACT|nr:hypothetical protein RESH_00526 [Rhodopirellula europaea SH398]